MRARVLFVRDVLPKYRAGDVSQVAFGYARNYLIPQGFAVLASQEQLKRLNTIKKVAVEHRRVETESLEALKERLEGVTLTVNARAGEGGRLYGSVTNMALAGELKAALDLSIDRRLIDLPEPIKVLGSYQVPIRLGPEITATITVVVAGEDLRAAEATEEPAVAEAAEELAAAEAAEEPAAAEATEEPAAVEAEEEPAAVEAEEEPTVVEKETLLAQEQPVATVEAEEERETTEAVSSEGDGSEPESGSAEEETGTDVRREDPST